jgi:predicted transcriptional regulator
MTDKERVRALVDAQPESASFEDIVRELAFERMIERGMANLREGRTTSSEEMKRRIESWRK